MQMIQMKNLILTYSMSLQYDKMSSLLYQILVGTILVWR